MARRFRTLLPLLLFLAPAGLAARVPAGERAALVAFYQSTDGGGWRDHTGWLGRPGTECRWLGVTCDAQGSAVVALQLASNGLAGGLPPELGDLGRLRLLDLRANAIRGPIPPELGRATALEILDLAFNHLAGEVPPEIGALTRLRVLALESNGLTRLPASLGDLAELVVLDVAANPVSDLPDSLAGLTKLRSLDVHGGRLTEIPPPVLAVRSLEELDLSGNRMDGSGIPEALGGLDRLVRLACASCGLAGPLPAGIGSFAQLGELDLRDNALTALPEEIGELAALQRLLLSGNRLTRLPAGVGGLLHLQILLADGNRLEGGIPDLSRLTDLRVLDLSANPFEPGPVPEGLHDLRRLRELRLRAAGRTGEIPSWLADLQHLAWLDLGDNPFDPAPVPGFLFVMTGLRRILLDGTGRTGALPEWIAQLPALALLSLRDNPFDPGPLPSFLVASPIAFVDLGGTARTGLLPPEIAANPALRVLRIDHNHLRGPIPAEWGGFASLEVLALAANRLTGTIPADLVRLAGLRDGAGLDLRWNALTQGDPGVIDFLDRKQVATDWRSTQTVPPRNLQATLTGPTRVRLAWNPILYREGSGAYEALHATAPDGPFTVVAATADKRAGGLEVSGLAPRARHYFRLRTVTLAGADNPNRVTSAPGPLVEITTLPESALSLAARRVSE